MARSPRRSAVVVLVLAVVGASSSRPQAASAVPAQATAAQPAKAAGSELDKKLAEIMKPGDGPDASAARIQRLEQFIRENPTYPRLETAYSNLLMSLRFEGKDPAKTIAIADEALKKYAASTTSVRANAIAAKYAALRQQKDDKGAAALSEQVLATETNVDALREAARADKANAIGLYEKAIAERTKNPSTDMYAWMDTLRWSYADCLNNAGRADDAMKIWTELIEVTKQRIVTLETLPKNDPQRIQLSRARMTLAERYVQMSKFYADGKEYDRAIEFVRLAEENGGYNPLEATAAYARRRADIYARAGKPDLELEQRTRQLAAELDPQTRDRILPLLQKTGGTWDGVLGRARQIRKENAVAVSGFALKSLDDKTMTLDSIRSKVTLVNFFFPT